MSVGIVVSDWNPAVTHGMLRGAVDTLLRNGVKEDSIFVRHVPGSFELIYGASAMSICHHFDVDAIIVLGCVIRGETPHFDYVCQGVTTGIAKLNAEAEKPVIFGLLTTDNLEQAQERAGGKLGNKGAECAVDAIKMISFSWELAE
jgi:6,7-dimethyl-8-ribityllumazine synthase